MDLVMPSKFRSASVLDITYNQSRIFRKFRKFTEMVPLALFWSLKGCVGACIQFRILIPDLDYPGPNFDKAKTKKSPDRV